MIKREKNASFVLVLLARLSTDFLGYVEHTYMHQQILAIPPESRGCHHPGPLVRHQMLPNHTSFLQPHFLRVDTGHYSICSSQQALKRQRKIA